MKFGADVDPVREQGACTFWEDWNDGRHVRMHQSGLIVHRVG